MRFASNTRLLGWITLILVGGFLTTSVAAFLASRDAVERSISSQALPLTGDSIYSELQKDILYPVFISSMMAHDAFVRDWMAGGEKNQEQIQRYLHGIKGRYGMIGSFLGSDASRRLYHTYGPPETLSENRPYDAWFFRLKALKGNDYETNIDVDLANHYQKTLFINYRVLDEQGKFLGVTGVGITLDAMNEVLARYQARFGRDIYFVDADGKVMLSGTETPLAPTLAARPGMAAIAPAILNRSGKPTSLSYMNGQAEVLVNSRFIPELRWYLVVEQNVSGNYEPLKRIFAVNFGISSVISLLVLAGTLFTVSRFQRRLHKMATTDALTGLLNRQALNVLFRQAILSSKRSEKPLSAILFDIDHFKQINDAFGHVAGDAVIRQVGSIAQDTVRASDVVTRWGGEEYFILLGDCPLAQACAIADNLRLRIAEHDFQLPGERRVTVSLGVAEYVDGEGETSFFARADQAMYTAKNSGRDQLSF